MQLKTWRELPQEKKPELKININYKLQIKSNTKDSPRPSQTETAKNLDFVTRQDSKIQNQPKLNDPEY